MIKFYEVAKVHEQKWWLGGAVGFLKAIAYVCRKLIRKSSVGLCRSYIMANGKVSPILESVEIGFLLNEPNYLHLSCSMDHTAGQMQIILDCMDV